MSMTESSSGSLISLLRKGTSAEHVLIEGAMPVMSESFNIESYLKLLERLFGFYSRYEPCVEAALELNGRCQLSGRGTLSDVLTWDRRKKLPRLRRDLISLGLDDAALSTLKLFEQFQSLDSAGSLFGALYVTEGSTLGGAVISRHLLSKHPSLASSLEHFQSYGHDVGMMWRDFLRAAETLVPESEHGEALEAAVQTFRSLRIWLTTG